jgi:hemerythrin-like metal-binding protein
MNLSVWMPLHKARPHRELNRIRPFSLKRQRNARGTSLAIALHANYIKYDNGMIFPTNHKENIMKFIEWSEHFSVGNERMDNQHRELFDIIADLRTAMTSEDVLVEYEAEWEVVERMIAYAVRHLSEEEQLLEECNYPDLAKHKEMHREFLAKILEIEKAIENGDDAPSVEKLCDFLENWLSHHILEADRQYRPYLDPKHRSAEVTHIGALRSAKRHGLVQHSLRQAI